MRDDTNWDWTEEEIKRVGHRVVDLLADYLTRLPERPVFRPVPLEVIDEFAAGRVPAVGESVDAVLDEFVANVAAYPFGNGHPRFFGWVNPPPTVIGVFAAALAAAMNPSVAGGNHAAVHVEHQVIRWLKALIGFPDDGSMGLLVSGGSMANLTGLAVARHVKLPDVRAKGMQNRDSRAVAYVSAEGHTCIRKSLEVLGFGSENIRMVPVDNALTMNTQVLSANVQRDRDAGHTPVVVAASAGTASTGAIDRLQEVHDVCRRHDVWFHVDASYGGPAILTEEYERALAPLRSADSVALDPHKWLSVPIDAGVALVRDGAAMRDAFSLVPDYIRTDGNSDQVLGQPWLSEYGFEQTRAFRALKVWMALKHHGIDGYAKSIRRDLALAERLADLVRRADDLQLTAPPSLSIVCFRYVPEHLKNNESELNRFNKRLLEAVQLGGQAFLSSTTVNGVFCLRACVINHRAVEADIDFLVEHVLEVGRRVGSG